MKARERAHYCGIALITTLVCLLCFSATALAHSIRSHRHHRSGTAHMARHHQRLDHLFHMARYHQRLGPIILTFGPGPAPDSTQSSAPTPTAESPSALAPTPKPTSAPVPGPISTPISEPPSEPESTPSEPPSEPESTPSEPPSEPESTPSEPPSEPESTPSEPPSEPESTPSEPPSGPEAEVGLPAGYKLLFEDEFDQGSLDNFVQGSDNTGNVTVDETAGIATITLPAGVSEPREELSINSSDQHFAEGQQFVLELERWLSPSTVPGGPGSHFTIAQFKGHEGRFPMVSEEFGNYNNQGNGLYIQDKNLTANPNYRVASYGLGEWHTDRMYVAVSKIGLGAYTISVDGKQVANVTGTNTLEPVDSYGFIKIGAYGQPQGKAIEMKLRNIRLYVPE